MNINDWKNFYNMFEKLYKSGKKNQYINLLSEYSVDESGNKNDDIVEQFYAYVSDYAFGTSCIKVMSDNKNNNEFKKYKGKLLYHGFKNFDYGARELTSWNHHYGRGVFGSGVYTTSDKEEALKYTDNNVRQWEERILPLKVIEHKKKAVSYDDIANIAVKFMYEEDSIQISPKFQEKNNALMDFLDMIPDSDIKYEFQRCLQVNPSILAIMFGYNYIERSINHKRCNDIVLDRSILIAPQSKAQQFLDLSQNFNDGILDPITLSQLNKELQQLQGEKND